jgi:uncharacterized repeat protein (TIGR03803 family)
MNIVRVIVVAVSISAGAAVLPSLAAEHATTPIYDFKGGSDGDDPIGGLVADQDGNIYGTDYYDGACGYCGTVFMLRPPTTSGDPWSFRVIYSFPSNSGEPTGALTIRNGVIYGTAYTEVFRLRPLDAGKTSWKHTTLYKFKSLSGQRPEAGVVFGLDGALYGTTIQGGKQNAGTLFRLTGSGDTQWSYELLYAFEASKKNGDQAGPAGELLVDPKTGVIYGTTYSGGKYGQGTVFSLALNAGVWQHTVLHDFRGVYTFQQPDGSQPRGALTFGADGAIYGTTESGDKGGSWNQGTIFRLLPQSGGGWTYSILHEFTGGDTDGSEPKSGLLLGGDGSFYGTTSGGGAAPYEGVVYRFAQSSKGKWGLTVLHHFLGGKDGANPWSRPVSVKNGLFGTTIQAGLNTRCNQSGCGSVYRVSK